MGYYTNNKTGYEAPLLRNKGEATMMFAQGLGKFADRMRESDQFKQKMDYSNSEALRDQVNKDREFTYGKERDTVQDNQWQKGYDLKATDMYFDQDYKTKALKQNNDQFNTTQSNLMKRHNDELGLGYSKLQQPDYKTFETVDKDGKPVLGYYNANNPSDIKITDKPLYQSALSPEKQEYYKEQTKSEKESRIKALTDRFFFSSEREKMDNDEIIKAERYISTYGEYPQIKDGKVVIPIQTPQAQAMTPQQQANDFAGIEAMLKEMKDLQKMRNGGN